MATRAKGQTTLMSWRQSPRAGRRQPGQMRAAQYAPRASASALPAQSAMSSPPTRYPASTSAAPSATCVSLSSRFKTASRPIAS